jgi:hypothetical protein
MGQRVSAEAFKFYRGWYLTLLHLSPALSGSLPSPLVLYHDSLNEAEAVARMLRPALGQAGARVTIPRAWRPTGGVIPGPLTFAAAALLVVELCPVSSLIELEEQGYALDATG